MYVCMYVCMFVHSFVRSFVRMYVYVCMYAQVDHKCLIDFSSVLDICFFVSINCRFSQHFTAIRAFSFWCFFHFLHSTMIFFMCEVRKCFTTNLTRIIFK